MFLLYYNIPQTGFYLFDFSIKINENICYLKLLAILFLGIFLALIQYVRLTNIHINFEFIIYLFINFISLFNLVSSTNFLSFFLCLELLSFSVYLILVHKQNSIFAIEAGLKYFIMSSIISCFFLVGLGCFYFCYGAITFEDLRIFAFNLFTINNNVEYFRLLFGFVNLLAQDNLEVLIISIYFDFPFTYNHSCFLSYN
jgi:NADH-quinone oxidoreductase subunit N